MFACVLVFPAYSSLTGHVGNGSVIKKYFRNPLLLHLNLVHVRLLCESAQLQKPRSLFLGAKREGEKRISERERGGL